MKAHTDKMLEYRLGRKLGDSGWHCRRCGCKFAAKATARNTPCNGKPQASGPKPATTTEMHQ